MPRQTKMRHTDELTRITCFYCGANVAKDNVEYDHFPIPKRYGGEAVVPACVTCHDMKDRYAYGDWPTDWYNCLVNEYHKFSTATRILMAKMLAAFAENQFLQIEIERLRLKVKEYEDNGR